MSVDSFYIPKKTELCSGTYTYRGDIPDIEISQENLSYIAGFTFLLGLQAILLNMYVLGYYREKRDGVFPLYYFITTLSNSVLGLDAVLHTLLLVLYVIYSPADTSSSQRLFNYIIFITYTLTSTARNSKLVYNTILISMRAVKYCSPSHVFSRKTSAAVILLFPIAWMLFLASTLTFHFALPAEVFKTFFQLYDNSRQAISHSASNPLIQTGLLTITTNETSGEHAAVQSQQT